MVNCDVSIVLTNVTVVIFICYRLLVLVTEVAIFFPNEHYTDSKLV